MNTQKPANPCFLKWLIVCCVLVFILNNEAMSLLGDGGNEKIFSVKVQQNGEVILESKGAVSEKLLDKYFKRRFSFGMPSKSANKMWQEDGILHLEWIHDNIVYTMSLFLCPRTDENAKRKGRGFVVVKIHGENLNSEYKEARAGFSVKIGEKRASFGFNNGIVSLNIKDRDLNLAAIEVPTGCSVNKKDDVIEFSGSMPPGTTGFMIFKIPLMPDWERAEVSELLNLDFEDCLNAYKKTSKVSEGIKWNLKDGIYCQDF